MPNPKTREIRLRNTAKRRGLDLHKSRRRDPLAPDFGRWWVVDPRARSTKWPRGQVPARGFPKGGGTLDDVEAFLATNPPQKGRDDQA